MNANSNGIGLNLSKRLAQALGGDLTLSSHYRTGCQFTLHMPLRMSEHELGLGRVNNRLRPKKKKKKGKKRTVPLPSIQEVEEEHNPSMTIKIKTIDESGGATPHQQHVPDQSESEEEVPDECNDVSSYRH